MRAHRSDPYKKVAERLGVGSARTVRSVAHKAGFHRRIARRKPYLSKKTVARRVKWAQDNAEQRWDLVVFTDEALIELGKRPRRYFVIRQPGEELLTENVQPTFSSGCKSIAVWACIAYG
jgi:hypothetical protein